MFDFQTGIVSPEVSGVYRFGMAALIMFMWAIMNKETLRFVPVEHAFLALQGTFMFALNIVFLYLRFYQDENLDDLPPVFLSLPQILNSIYLQRGQLKHL